MTEELAYVDTSKKTLWVLQWRYFDGSAGEPSRAYYVKEAAEQDLRFMQLHANDMKQWSIHEVEFIS